MDPQHTGLALRLALTYLTASDETLRDAREGLRFAERAAGLSPEHPRAAAARALALLANHRPEEAIEAARSAEQLGADRADCLLISAIASHRLGRLEEAQRMYSQARALAGEPADHDPIHQTLLGAAADLFEPPEPQP